MLNNQVGKAAAEVLLKFCLVFVISLFAFAVGTFVGKKFTEDQHRLANLEQQGSREAASIGDITEEVAPESKLTAEELQSLTEEFSEAEAANIEEALAEHNERDVAAEKLAEEALQQLDEDLKQMEKDDLPAKEDQQAMASPNTDNASAAKADATEDTTSKVAKRLAENAEKVVVEPPKKVNRVPASYPKLQASARAGKFTVQIASYKAEKEAKDYVSQLTSKGYTAFYVEAKVKGEMWYRVSLGLFANMDAANKYMKELYKEAKIKGFVTKVVQ
tara:strand:- start:8831 stop:9655 length:825 start_codon:yes stop_codon:yes gene_type:complete